MKTFCLPALFGVLLWCGFNTQASAQSLYSNTFDDAASITGWTPVADATNSAEASLDWNAEGALSLTGVNTADDAGRAYIFQFADGAFDFQGATSVTLSFDLKTVGALAGTAVHLQTEFPGVGTGNTFDLQTQGLNDAGYTSYSYTFDNLTAGSLFRVHFNLAAGAFSGAGGTLLVDNLALTSNGGGDSGDGGDTTPVASAPTDNPAAPTRDAADVISVYGDSYTPIAFNLNPDWGQSTQVNAAYDPGTGDVVMQYANLNYQGTDVTATDASSMTHLHVDVWVAEGTDRLLKVSPVNNGSGAGEVLVNVPLTPGSWNSVDLPKSAFTGMSWDNVFQMKFDGQFNGDGSANTTGWDVYLDNLYFYEEAGAPVAGCMDQNAVNYNSAATVDDATCTYNVTFRVDMANFTGAAFGGVFVNGSFNNWCGDCNPMADADQDGVWDVTLPLVAGTIEYKFTLDGWTQQEEFQPGGSCTVTNGGFTNRVLTIDGVEDLATVCYNSCADCAQTPGCMDQGAVNYSDAATVDDASCLYAVTFQVDVSQYAGMPDGATVFTNGAYNGWCGGCNAMTDAGNGLWTGTFNLPAGNQEYKFTINGWNDQEYFNGTESCTTAPAEFVNRVVNVSAATTLPVVCWNTCEACADITNLTAGTGHASIQDAIDAASAGDVIEILDGSYAIATPILVNKAVTVQGQSEAGTVLTCEAALGGANSIQVTAGATLKDFTLEANSYATFGIHVQPGTANALLSGLTINNTGSNGIGLSGVTNATVSDIAGSGNVQYILGIAGSVGVSASDISGGNVGVYKGTGTYAQTATDIAFTGTFELAGGFIIEQLAGADEITYAIDGSAADVQIPATFNRAFLANYGNLPLPPPYDVASLATIVELEDLATVIGTAFGLQQAGIYTVNDAAVYNLAADQWEVSAGFTIQDAIDRAEAGDVIDVAAGTFAPETTLAVDKSLTIQGAGQEATTIDGSGIAAPGYGFWVTASSVSLKDFAFNGGGATGLTFGLHFQPGTSDLALENLSISACGINAIAMNGVNGQIGANTITNVTTSGNGLYGLGLGAAQNVTVSGFTSANNAGGDIGIYGSDYSSQTTSDLVFNEPLTLQGGFTLLKLPEPYTISYSTAEATDADYLETAAVRVPAAYDQAFHADRAAGVDPVTGAYPAEQFVGLTTESAIAATVGIFGQLPEYSGLAVRDLGQGQWEVFPGLAIGDAIDRAEAGDVIDVAAGTYAEALTLSQGATLNGNGSTLDVSGLGVGISIQSDVDGVTVDNFAIVGDASTYSGITVNPGASNVSILNSDISGMALSNPANSSPLSYGILCWGNADPVNPPSNILINGNEIHGVSGTAISLGDNTEGVTISDNHFHDITQVTVDGTPWSSGVVAGQANNLTISGNNMDGLDYASALTACTGVSLASNQYTGGTSLMLLASLPNSILPDATEWWSVEAAAIGYISYFNSAAAQTATDAGMQLAGVETVLSSSNPGCMDADACNFDTTALSEDGSCTYPPATYFDCNGVCENDADGDGICDELEGLIPELETACGANTVWDPVLGQCIMNVNCIGDVDLDGHVGATDLLYLLGNFGTYCQGTGGDGGE